MLSVLFGRYFYVQTQNLPLSVFTAILLYLPIEIVVMQIIQYILSKTIKPKLIPKLDFQNGVPKKSATFVVIPTIITETEKLQEMMKKLEVYYLANKSDNLYFALLADVSASDKQEEVFDEEIGRLGVELAQKLNAKYPDNTFPKFHFLYRKREWNDKEECYLGWERKRGMLTQFNAYILKRKENEFRVNTIDREKLPNIKYVITLDADTELVLNSGLELIGAMAHILNTPEIEKGVVAKRTWYFTATCRGYLRSG